MKTQERDVTPKSDTDLYVVRHWDGFDGEWMDVFGPAAKSACDAYWREKTDNGKKNSSYDDIDYYRVFPADTKMQYSEGRSMTRG